MAYISSFKDLTVWQKSFELVKDVYLLTTKLPRSEQFGLISQIQRCAVSIPSNIAEGQQRNSSGEFRQSLGIAKGSAAELETQLLLAKEIYGLDISVELILLDEVQKMLNAIIKKLPTNH
jgi:four helix bundle protein